MQQEKHDDISQAWSQRSIAFEGYDCIWTQSMELGLVVGEAHPRIHRAAFEKRALNVGFPDTDT
jgi:hypothetical protein